MAEGLCRHLRGDVIDCHSCGTETHGLNPLAVRAMAEIGIDISGHTSKRIEALADKHFDVVVTVCGHADERCPVFPGDTRIVHRRFDDPPKLAAAAETEEDAMVHYRRVRDEIRDFVAELPGVVEDAK